MAAIYMWFVNGVQYEVLTTTPYPIEVIEKLQFAFNIHNDCSMSPLPGEAIDFSYSLTGGSLNTILLTAGPYYEAIDFSYSLTGGLLNTILLTAGPYYEAIDFSYELLGGSLISLLVTVDTPDEKLQLVLDVVPSGCSMTHI
jgi:hypothetical protein